MNILQFVLVVLAVAALVVLWRLDGITRRSKALEADSRAALAEQKQAVDRLKQYADDWGRLNERRAAINNRYDDTVTRVREKFGIEGGK
jgi:type II secretory pathway pseudopilin PulG